MNESKYGSYIKLASQLRFLECFNEISTIVWTDKYLQPLEGFKEYIINCRLMQFSSAYKLIKPELELTNH